MSAAATAAGYLYASGRLRGCAAREQEQQEPKQERPAKEKRIRVAVMPAREQGKPAPRRTPKIEYRVRRRWSAE